VGFFLDPTPGPRIFRGGGGVFRLFSRSFAIRFPPVPRRIGPFPGSSGGLKVFSDRIRKIRKELKNVFQYRKYLFLSCERSGGIPKKSTGRRDLPPETDLNQKENFKSSCRKSVSNQKTGEKMIQPEAWNFPDASESRVFFDLLKSLEQVK
jgi:hypothetical protein